MKDQNIEKIFRDSLGNLEAEVNPEIWTSIGEGLKTPVPGNPVSGGATAFKSAGIFGKMSINSLLLITAVTVTTVSAVFFLTKEKTELNTEEQPAVVELKNVAVPASIINTEIPEPTTNRLTEPGIPAHPMPDVPKESQQRVTPAIDKASQGEPVEAQIQPTVANAASTPSHTNSGTMIHQPPDQIASAAETENPASQEAVEAAEPTAVSQEKKEENTENPLFDANIEKYLAGEGNTEQKLPNIFTPNNDNYNDVFKIKSVNMKSLEVSIFDHRGNKIITWNSLEVEWDGKLPNGKEAPSGNYFYSLSGETVDGKICIAQSPLKLTRN